MKRLKKIIKMFKEAISNLFCWLLLPYKKLKRDKLIKKMAIGNQMKRDELKKRKIEMEEKMEAIKKNWPKRVKKFYKIYKEAKEIYFSKFTWEEKNNWFFARGSWISIIDQLTNDGFVVDYKKDENHEKNVRNFMTALQKKVDRVCTENKDGE
jgi:hypothetical protein